MREIRGPESDDQNLPRISLEEYRQLFDEEDRPTDAQIANFVKYVANAHSWYKHLPAAPPGLPFSFYLDPFAGCDAHLAEDGKVVFIERTAERGFHYNYRTTKVWREQFGLLQYASSAGTRFYVPGPNGYVVTGSAQATCVNLDGVLRRLPLEVEEAGEIPLTAFIHRYFSFLKWCWHAGEFRDIVKFPHPLSIDWPEEFGGNALRDKLAAATPLVEPRGDGREPSETEYRQFNALLSIPREAQLAQMRTAMRQVRSLVFPGREEEDAAGPPSAGPK